VPPHFFSRNVVTDKPKTPEVTDHQLSICGTTRGSGAAFGGMKFLKFFRGNSLFPKLLAILAVITMDFEFSAIERSQENPITAYHW